MNFDQLITSLRELDRSLKERAAYGESLIPTIASKLKIKGLATRNLEACRLFYQAYPEIPQSATAESGIAKLLIPRTLSGELPPGSKIQTASDFFKGSDFALSVATLVQKLTFTHFVELLRSLGPHQMPLHFSPFHLKQNLGSYRQLP